MDRVPKNIFTYWHQGFDNAPRLVRFCVERAIQLHPDWQFHLLDQTSLKEVQADFPMPAHNRASISLAAWSDLVRTQLLLKYGGIWMDPTVFCARPVDQWLPDLMDAGIFLFTRPGRDRIVSSWFIASEPENPWLAEVNRLLIAYWEGKKFKNLGREYTWLETQLFRVINRNIDWPRVWFSPVFRKLYPLQPYFFFHYAFREAISTSEAARRVWIAMPRRSADGPHKLLRLGLLSCADKRVQELLSSPSSTVFKLNWKTVPEDFPQDSIVGLLEETALAEAHPELNYQPRVHSQ